MLIKGTALNDRQRAQVLGAFGYRWTHENANRVRWYGWCAHCETWGGLPGSIDPACPKHHPVVSLEHDAEWIARLAFHFIKNGSRLMANRPHAEPAFLAG